MNDDQPLPLGHLRDEMPLNDFDFAAVRARVHSEMARREGRSWLAIFRWATAMALIVLALQVKEHAPRGAGASATDFRSKPAPEAGAAPQVAIATPVTHRKKKKYRHPPARVAPAAVAVSRIEIHTADPDIRIIWIVPKENS